MKSGLFPNYINKFFVPDFKKYRVGILSGNIGISQKELVFECLSRCKELWILIPDTKDSRESSRRIREAYSIEGVDRVLLYQGERNLEFMIREISPDIRFLQKEYEGKIYPGFKTNIPVHYLDF